MSADSCCAARANFALLLFSGCFEFISRMKCARTREREAVVCLAGSRKIFRYWRARPGNDGIWKIKFINSEEICVLLRNDDHGL